MGAICVTRMTSKSKCAPLHIMMIEAAANGCLSDVKIFLDHKVDVNQCDHGGRSALHLACAEGHSDIVELLVRHGADIHRTDSHGRDPLQEAVLAGHNKIEATLKEAGAVHCERWKAEMQAKFFHYAAQDDATGIISLLDRSCVEINAVDYRGRTALHIAADRGHAAVVATLVKRNADLNICDSCGDTPLDVVRRQNHRTIECILASVGATASSRKLDLQSLIDADASPPSRTHKPSSPPSTPSPSPPKHTNPAAPAPHTAIAQMLDGLEADSAEAHPPHDLMRLPSITDSTSERRPPSLQLSPLPSRVAKACRPLMSPLPARRDDAWPPLRDR